MLNSFESEEQKFNDYLVSYLCNNCHRAKHKKKQSCLPWKWCCEISWKCLRIWQDCQWVSSSSVNCKCWTALSFLIILSASIGCVIKKSLETGIVVKDAIKEYFSIVTVPKTKEQSCCPWKWYRWLSWK